MPALFGETAPIANPLIKADVVAGRAAALDDLQEAQAQAAADRPDATVAESGFLISRQQCLMTMPAIWNGSTDRRFPVPKNNLAGLNAVL